MSSTDNGSESREHKCDRRDPNTRELCNRTFSKASNLTRHKRIHDHTTKPHHCDVCSKGFARQDALKKHRKRFHPGTTSSAAADRPGPGADNSFPERHLTPQPDSHQSVATKRHNQWAKEYRARFSNAIRDLQNILPDQGRPGEQISKVGVIEMAAGCIKALKEQNMKLLRTAGQNPLSEGLQATPDTTTLSVKLDSGPNHYQQGWPTDLSGSGFDSGFLTSVPTQPPPIVSPSYASAVSGQNRASGSMFALCDSFYFCQTAENIDIG